MVGANTFRNPGLTAKLATTLDHVSDGRAVLGIGGAWFEREHDAFGIDFGATVGERLDRLDEAVMLIRRLLDGERFSHQGRFYVFEDALSEPRPVQRRLPILVGGSGPRKTLHTVALRADGWNTSGTLEEVEGRLAILGEHCSDVGRDLATIEKTISFPDPHPRRSSRGRARLRRPSGDQRRRQHGQRPGPVRLPGRSGGRDPAVRSARLRDRDLPHVGAVRRRDHRPHGRGPRAARRMNVVALAGGTGGAKLAAGLQAVLSPGDLTVIVNTGDDTERHGLLVMPDHDAVMYMLAGRFDFERGWGEIDETWTVMDGLAEYGEEAWFRLGDRDFATHIARTSRIAAGRRLTEAVRSLQTALGIPTPILPMADGPVRTRVRTRDGWLDFQEYFVRLRQGPEVHEVAFEGEVETTPDVGAAIAGAGRHRHRPVEPDRLDRADPRRPDPRAGRGAGTRRDPGRRGQPDRGRGRAERPRGPDAGLARSRVERGRRRPPVPGSGDGVRARCRGRRARARGGRARVPTSRGGHGHGGCRWAGPGGPCPCSRQPRDHVPCRRPDRGDHPRRHPGRREEPAW
jgi:alkanesulfonate monooxygenase SsuD/methylene tetrahydromethanopterin reductase-like flavin-dependent oxidoreductase (luciferase family)